MDAELASLFRTGFKISTSISLQISIRIKFDMPNQASGDFSFKNPEVAFQVHQPSPIQKVLCKPNQQRLLVANT